MNTKIVLFLISLMVSGAVQASEPRNWTLEASTENGLFAISLQPKEGEPVIGDYHDWVITVTDENNEGIENAEFNFAGGMEAHGHGLPSQPTVTQYLGDGKYLVEGMLFNMAGDWTLLVAIRKNQFSDKAAFDITLGF